MVLFIFGILFILGGLICLFAINSKDYGNIGKIIFTICLVVGILLSCISCFSSVPTGHTGIVTTFGKVENYTLDAGFHFLVPWHSVVKMDNRVQKATFNLSAFSKDIQEVDVTYTLNYQIDQDNAQILYRTIGKDYLNTVIYPNVAECVKVGTSKYNAEGLVGDRSTLAANIENLLSEALESYNIKVVSTAIENLDFTDAFTNAVEAKQVAQQNKLRAQTEQEQKTLEQQAAADREVIDANAKAEVAKIAAQADLEVTKIQADAAEYAGLKEAAKNKAISEWLTPELIRYYYIQQWNGILPTTYMGTEDVTTLINLE